MSKSDIITIGHSPDPDDAFMVWALAEGVVHADDFGIALVARDIETLNKWALADARLEVTALSAATFARVADRYWLLRHGASFGDGYGPIVVAKRPMTLAELSGVTVASPGENTTAHAALRLAAPGVQTVTKAFDKILPLVENGEVEAGLLIHEGQITWERSGLHKVVDLGAWWKAETGLPLPLGVNALRKDLGAELGADVGALLQASIEVGLASRTRALAYARQFGRGISQEDADTFVRMYVNEMTRDMGELGQRAIAEFARRTGATARIELAPED
ncbi:MAG TPA: MqnA/MqnD/SBP family protein [Candidatus Thermoplasmatota archaeon]|nr:MqnA/MqnD/SBP family protein [Candidatus Thermoplasmatota archaeon]